VGEETGHPTLIAESLFGQILSDPGDQGLRGALNRCGAEFRRIQVEDRGILHDADTPEDFQALLKYHNRQLIRPVLQVSLSKEKVFFDSRTAMLLRLIEETNSVRLACQRMQMSYSSGWNVIRTLESQLKKTLILRNQGGAGGGSSSLTEDGRFFLQQYEAYTAEVRNSALQIYEHYFQGMF
jgi:molybdate transport repressor ModE-like protein